MRMLGRTVGAFVVALGVSLVGCTSLLGDFSLTDGGVGFDATSDGATGDAEAPDVVASGEGAAPNDGGGDTSAAEGGCPADEVPCNGACVPSDVHNCGACGNDCTSLVHVVPSSIGCNGGACVYQCESGFGSCGDAGGGCDTNLSQQGNCGKCGVLCSGGTPVCETGDAGTASCGTGCSPPKPTLCNSSCVDTTNDPQNCAACGHACSTAVANAQPTCTSSACGYACNPTYTSCGGGCWNTQSDVNHCGSSCAACAAKTNATATCSSGSCVYACNPGTTTCSGSCVDLQTDANNCGACGHGCLGGSCATGLCQPFAIATLPSAQGTGWSLTVDNSASGNTYYTTFISGGVSTLYSCPKSGCTSTGPAVLTATLNSPDAIAWDVGTNEIFVADTYNGAVEAWSTSGSKLATLSVSNPTSIAVDTGYVYYGTGTSIVRASKNLTTTTSIASSLSASVHSLTSDYAGGWVFGGAIGPTGAIAAAPISGSGSSVLAGNQPYPQQIAIQNGVVYWIDQGTNGGANGGVYLCAESGCSGNPTTVVGSVTQGTCIFTTSSYVYYAANGTFYRCPLGGACSSPTVMATNVYPLQGASCAQDSNSFYFLQAQTSLLRLAK